MFKTFIHEQTKCGIRIYICINVQHEESASKCLEFALCCSLHHFQLIFDYICKNLLSVYLCVNISLSLNVYQWQMWHMEICFFFFLVHVAVSYCGIYKIDLYMISYLKTIYLCLSLHLSVCPSACVVYYVGSLKLCTCINNAA